MLYLSRTGTRVVVIDSIMSVPSLSAMRKILYLNYIYSYLFISLLFIFISIFTSINIFVNCVLIESGYTTAFT